MAKTKFEVYKDGKGHYRWRLLAQNGEAVANAGEGFTEKRGAMNSVKKLKDWANTSNIVDIEKQKEDAAKAKAAASKKKTAPVKKAAAPAKKAVKKATKKVAAKKTPEITPVI